MSKHIFQYLMESTEFCDMWADDYSSQQEMVDSFTDKFDTGDLTLEVEIACAYLDAEMRQTFIQSRFKK